MCSNTSWCSSNNWVFAFIFLGHLCKTDDSSTMTCDLPVPASPSRLISNCGCSFPRNFRWWCVVIMSSSCRCLFSGLLGSALDCKAGVAGRSVFVIGQTSSVRLGYLQIWFAQLYSQSMLRPPRSSGSSIRVASCLGSSPASSIKGWRRPEFLNLPKPQLKTRTLCGFPNPNPNPLLCGFGAGDSGPPWHSSLLLYNSWSGWSNSLENLLTGKHYKSWTGRRTGGLDVRTQSFGNTFIGGHCGSGFSRQCVCGKMGSVEKHGAVETWWGVKELGGWNHREWPFWQVGFWETEGLWNTILSKSAGMIVHKWGQVQRFSHGFAAR